MVNSALCKTHDVFCMPADVNSAEISYFNWHQQYSVVLLEEIQLKIKKNIVYDRPTACPAVSTACWGREEVAVRDTQTDVIVD